MLVFSCCLMIYSGYYTAIHECERSRVQSQESPQTNLLGEADPDRVAWVANVPVLVSLKPQASNQPVRLFH